jgi:CRP/FNR family transcriptional regulator
MQRPPSAHCLSCKSFIGNIFCSLPKARAEELDRHKIVREYKKKQALFFEGNPAGGVYCIKTGLVKLYKTGPEGKQYILNLAGPTNVLGIDSVLSGQPHSATAEMIYQGTVCFIPKDFLINLAKQDCSLSMKISQFLAGELLKSEEERLDLAQMAVRERFARLLGLLAKSYGKAVPKGVSIDLKLNREEMAEMIGTAAETAMRLLKEFKEEKLLEIHGKEITILNKTGLEKAAQIF